MPVPSLASGPIRRGISSGDGNSRNVASRDGHGLIQLEKASRGRMRLNVGRAVRLEQEVQWTPVASPVVVP